MDNIPIETSVIETPSVSQENNTPDYKTQLIRSIELNDRLVGELETKEREISLFKELGTNYEQLINEKDRAIQTLQVQIQEVQMSKFNERREVIYRKWISKFNLTSDQTVGVQRMLSKFTSEGELEDIERMLEASVIKKETPVPLTQNSELLHDRVGFVQPANYDNMSKAEQISHLLNKIDQMKQIQTQRI